MLADKKTGSPTVLDLSDESDATTTVEWDPRRGALAIHITSLLFPVDPTTGRRRIPAPGTKIDKWVKVPSVKISIQARLNDTAPDIASQAGYGWKTVQASEVGACVFIEDLVGLVYSKLQPGESGPELKFGDSVQEYLYLLSAGEGEGGAE